MSADIPPTGEPGFDLYANQQGRIIASSVAFIVLTTAFVSLRLLSRRLSRAGLWWDDYLAVIAMSSFHPYRPLRRLWQPSLQLITSAEIHHGYGRHIYIYSSQDASVKKRLWLRTLYVFEPIYHTSTTFAKYSMWVLLGLLFYYRVFAIRQFKGVLYILAAFVTCYVLSVDFACLFQCTPVQSFWDEAVPGHCINIDHMFIASGSMNVVLDFIIFALPIPLLWRLRTSFNQKIVLTAIFTVAGLYSSPSPYFSVAANPSLSQRGHRNYINAGIWTVAEPSVAVICACLPSLRPLFPTAYSAMYRIPRKLPASHSSASGKWIKGRGSKGNKNGEEFSRLDEWVDQSRPMGHDVSVRGGGGEVEMGEVPREGIQVKTEVVLVSSERLEYEDRLF
ncbi:MAG: hypothetical protein LQ344_006759 [Seirophora lacunosa]|nr:MAG: hypothetical protein LQ344_006759 [Seirophora lacunosa]